MIHSFLLVSRFLLGGERENSEAPFFPAQLMSLVGNEADPVFIHGRIDRIDITSDGQQARILDYKSGKPIRGRFAGCVWRYSFHCTFLPLASCGQICSGWGQNTLPYGQQPYARRIRQHSHLIRGRKNWRCCRHWSGRLPTVFGLGVFPILQIRVVRVPSPLICGSQAETRTARKQGDARLAFLQKAKSTP